MPTVVSMASPLMPYQILDPTKDKTSKLSTFIKKVVSDSLGQLDFTVRPVDSVHHLSIWQVEFLGKVVRKFYRPYSDTKL